MSRDKLTHARPVMSMREHSLGAGEGQLRTDEEAGESDVTSVALSARAMT